MVRLLSIQPLNVFNEVLLVLTCYIHPADSTFRLLSRTWIIGYFEVHPLMTNRQKQKQKQKMRNIIFHVLQVPSPVIPQIAVVSLESRFARWRFAQT